MASRRSQSPWRRAAARSRSVPRVFLTSSSDDDADKRGGVSAWAPGWLLTPQHRQKDRTAQPASSKKHRPLLRRTPFLTLLLIRLDDCIQSYCEKLVDPTVKNAAAASAVLEATAMTASSPTSSPSSASTPTNTPPSPASPRSTASERAIEGECQKYVSPLMLLAGAEAIYAKMEHVLDMEQYGASNKLLSLYQKIENDLVIVKETLCKPFMGSEPEMDTRSAEKHSELSTHIMSNKAALSLAGALDTFMVVTSVRRELLMLHHDIFLASKEKDLLELSVRCRSLLKNLPESTGSSQACEAVMMMIQSIKSETKAMAAALATAYHLQRCSFMETVVNANVLKAHMRKNASTTLQMWFRSTLEHLLCVMQIFFDRIDAFCSPLYGFDKTEMALKNLNDSSERLGLVHDFDSATLEFIRRQGGSPMAVGLVIDAVQASCYHVGRGFENEGRHIETLTEQFPAVYMRTTVHCSSSGPGTLSSGVRGKLGIASGAFRPSQKILKNSSRRDVSEDEDHASGLRLSWSVDGGTPKIRKRKDARTNVLEYPPDSGSPSWPYVEWDTLVPSLAKVMLPSSVETSESLVETSYTNKIQMFRPSDPPSQGSIVVGAGSDGKSNAGGASPPKSPLSMPWVSDAVPSKDVGSPPAVRRSSGSSVHHVARLNEFMWLIVMVKEEESRWNLRRSRGNSDEDIHAFMDDMLSNLGVDRLFLGENVMTASKKVKSSGAETRLISLKSFVDDDEFQFLSKLKKTFGLRPQSPLMPLLKSRYQVGVSEQRGRGSITPSSSSYSDDLFNSAVALFFGEELASLLWSSGYF